MAGDSAALTTGRVAVLLGISDAQARRILGERDVEPVAYVENHHAPGGPSVPLWPASVVDALREAPEVLAARARRRPRTPADELAQIAAMLAPFARGPERAAATLRRLLRGSAAKPVGKAAH